MAELQATQKDARVTQSMPIPETTRPRLPIAIPIPSSSVRSGHLNLDVFSPVNQNGSFEFDRMLKSGDVYKRSRKTKQWKKFYLVLRPNLLSMYKNASEEKLLKQINLSDLTAVAYLKDPKGRRDHTFGLFSSSRNYHFQAASEKDARSWVELIRYESRIDEEEESMVFASPIAKRNTYQGLGQSMRSSEEQWERERLGSSSPEPLDNPKASTTRDGVRIPGIRKLSGHELDYSGAEHGSYSDFSDTAPTRAHETSGVASSTSAIRYASAANTVASQSTPMRPPTGRNTSQSNNLKVEVDDERVIWHGYLLCLKSKGGVRQWKKLWVVLRPKNLAFYKNEEEYSAHLLIPLSCIINAIEIDPISRSKSHCFQIIAEEKTYRFCAPSEESLARCLGALKSQLAKRKEKKEMIIRKSG